MLLLPLKVDSRVKKGEGFDGSFPGNSHGSIVFGIADFREIFTQGRNTFYYVNPDVKKLIFENMCLWY